MDREAIILAGGLGTRLRNMVKGVPKPMADIAGRPFLAYVLDHLAGQGIGRVLLSVGYRHDFIANYFNNQYNEMLLEYVVETEPQGTGGALRDALARIREERALVLNGDTYFPVDLGALAGFHEAHEADITMAVKPLRDYDRYGTVLLDGERIIGFREKTRTAFGHINGGVYVMEKRLTNLLDRISGPFSLERDFLGQQVSALGVFAFVSNDYFIDIGVPDDYARAQQELPRLRR